METSEQFTQRVSQLAAEIHADNVVAGWWTNKDTGESLIGRRNIGELLCLVHSEVDEAYYGWVQDLNDDKLPHRKMLEVELADTVIRVYDILGSKGEVPVFTHYVSGIGLPSRRFCEIHSEISRAMEGFRKGKEDKGVKHLVNVLLLVEDFCHDYNLDLEGAIAEKRAFNKVRPDHKLENRLKAGGKAF